MLVSKFSKGNSFLSRLILHDVYRANDIASQSVLLTPGPRTDLFTVKNKEDNITLQVKVWTGLLGATLKDQSYPKLWLLSRVSNVQCMQNSPGTISSPSYRHGGAKGAYENRNLCCLLCCNKVLCSVPGVSYLLPVSMKLWPAKLLTCRLKAYSLSSS